MTDINKEYEKEYYDEYRNNYYNPDDYDAEPGINLNWKRIQKGFHSVAASDQETAEALSGMQANLETLNTDVETLKTDVEEIKTAVDDLNNAVETAEQAAEAAAASEAAAQAAQAAIEEIAESIPEDYSDLSADVDDLKSALGYISNWSTSSATADVTHTLIPIVTGISLSAGATYHIKATIDSAITRDIYISLRDANSAILYSQNSTLGAGNTEKIMDSFVPTDDISNASICAYVYGTSVTTISPVLVTAQLINNALPEVEYETIDEIQNSVGDIDSRLPENQYRYLLFTMAGATVSPQGLIILHSNDGVTFDLWQKMGCYTCANTYTYDGTTRTNTLRDPAVIKIGKYFYLIYTIIGWRQGSAFGMCRTADFRTFEELQNVNMVDGEGNQFTRVWAPAWFQDAFKYYITVACESNSQFSMYILDFDPLTQTVTSTFKTNINSTDFHWYYSKGHYYALGNDTLFVSDTLKSTDYNRIKRGRSGVEGDAAIRLDNGRYRVYAALINGQFSDVEIGTYVEDDISNTTDIVFSPISLTESASDYQTELGYKFTHPTVFDRFDESVRLGNVMELEHRLYDN